MSRFHFDPFQRTHLLHARSEHTTSLAWFSMIPQAPGPSEWLSTECFDLSSRMLSGDIATDLAAPTCVPPGKRRLRQVHQGSCMCVAFHQPMPHVGAMASPDSCSSREPTFRSRLQSPLMHLKNLECFSRYFSHTSKSQREKASAADTLIMLVMCNAGGYLHNGNLHRTSDQRELQRGLHPPAGLFR